MEKLQQDSAKISLQDHKQELIGALEAEKNNGAPAAPGGSDDFGTLASEAALNATGGSTFSVAVSVADDLASTSKQNNAGGSMFIDMKNKKQGSMFVGGGVKVNSDKASRVTPLVPLSYSDKKAALKNKPASQRTRDDISARARVSSMSLTGSSLIGGGSRPIRGAAVNASDAKAIKVKEILDELAVTNRNIANPYENTKRLVQDYEKGVDVAENTMQRTAPEKIKNAAPKVAAQMQPQGPKGSSAS